MPVEFRLLGPVTVVHQGRALVLGPPQQRFILATLALEVNRLVPVERLVELVWPDPPRTASHAVRVCVSRLRSVLAAVPPTEVELVGGRSGYTLRAEPQSIDVHRFRQLLERARTEVNDDTRVALLDQALALWSGPALADAGSPEGRERLRQGLTEARLTAIEDRVDARLRLGRHAELLDELVGLVAAEPVRERLAGQLMLALHRGGQTSEALAVYQRIRRRLADEFGLDPGTGLRRLEAEILRGGATVDPEPVAPVGTGTTRDRAGMRVVLVDDHPLFRTGLRGALETGTDIAVVAEAAWGQPGTHTRCRGRAAAGWAAGRRVRAGGCGGRARRPPGPWGQRPTDPTGQPFSRAIRPRSAAADPAHAGTTGGAARADPAPGPQSSGLVQPWLYRPRSRCTNVVTRDSSNPVSRSIRAHAVNTIGVDRLG